MKNLTYIINGVLAVAVAALFVLHFSNGKSASTEATANGSEISIAPTGKIAFFHLDSVMANWSMYLATQEALASKQAQLEADMTSKSEGFVKRMEDAQYKVQRGLVTRAEAAELEQQLGLEQQNLAQLENSYSMQLQEEGMVKNRLMIDNLEQFLASYNTDKGYDYIFSYAFGGNLMYGNEAFNITSEVIAGINAKFPAETAK